MMNYPSGKNVKLLVAVSMAIVFFGLTFPTINDQGFLQAILISWVAALIGFGMTLWVISMFTE